jgi:hypothetical protein
MNIFVSVIFVCMNGTCGFLYSKEVFYNLAKCEATTRATMAELENNGAETAEGTCVPVKGGV